MTMNASIILTAQANQAKAELRAAAAETTKLKAATKSAGDEARRAAAGFDAEGRALAVVDKQTEQVVAAQTRLKTTSGMAAGSMGNLVAQFNDIGMMIASGQSPLMTAVQQGTQVAQVIGPMGATGAVKALGAAFMGMLNPINLVIMAGIAAGSAMVQWLFSAEEEVKTLDDAVTDLEGSVKALAERGKIDVKSLKDEFGAVTPEVIRLQQQITQLGEVQAINDMRAAIAALKGEAEGTWTALFNDKAMTDVDQAAGLLGVAPQKVTTGRAAPETNPVVVEFQATLESLNSAKGPTELLAAFEDLKVLFLDATGGIDQMDAAQLAFLGSVLATEEGLRQTVQTQKDIARAQEEVARAYALENSRPDQPLAKDRYEYQPPITLGADQQKMEALLQTLNAQADVQRLINQYGADSVQVTAARAETERAAFAEMVNSSEATDALKLELIAAYGAGAALAALDIASGIAAAAGSAAALARNLNVSLATASQMMAMGYSGAEKAVVFDPRDPNYDPVAADMARMKENYGTKSPFAIAPVVGTGTGTGAGSGGGAAARDEADAVGDLIAKLQEEYDLLLEVDPVKKEMLRYREQLASASDAERQSVEDLIRAEQTLNATREIGQQFSDMAADFLDQVFAKGARAIDVIRDLGATLASTLARSFITGEGPWASILGISGGLFAPQAKAEGGLIHGPGGPTDDMVPVAASAGEFMINAQATAQNLPLLEAINSGEDIPARMQDAASFQTPAYARRATDPTLGDIQKRAGGGMIYGPGGPTDDQVLMWGSAGEYMVNAEATSRHRPLLELINAGGDIPGFAKGGPIGGAATATSSSPGGRGKSPMNLTFNLAGAKGNAEIERIVVGAVETAMTHYDREVLPLRVNDIASGGMVFG